MKSLVFYESLKYLPSNVELYINDLSLRYYGGCKAEIIPINVAYYPMTTQLFKYVNFQYIKRTPAVVMATDDICNKVVAHINAQKEMSRKKYLDQQRKYFIQKQLSKKQSK